MRTKTIKKALSEGYTFCGVSNQEWQSLIKIEDLCLEDFEYQDFYLADQKPTVFKFDKNQISELLADIISDNESNESGRDNDELYKAIKEIDFSETEKQIKTVLEKFKSYGITDIKLILK